MNIIEYQELIIFHPGYYVKDLMDDAAITQEELAKRLQTSPEYVTDLINGEVDIDDVIAESLADAFGTSVSMWKNLNETFMEKKQEIERRKAG